MRAALALAIVAGATRLAAAYPQYQLASEPTCTGCHVSPAGGGPLTENGRMFAEAQSTWGGDASAGHGALETEHVELTGDVRGAAGFVRDQNMSPAAFPMQFEPAVQLRAKAFTAYATVGFMHGNESSPASWVIAREHWLMWQRHPDQPEGLYVRAGRFMPVFGLRFVEHNDSVRRWGQTQLYGETYGVAVEQITPAWEAHLTGFVHDPIQDPVERGDGAAAYAEARFAEHYAAGAELRYANAPDDVRTTGGVTAKAYLAPILIELEAQLTHQRFTAGSARDQIVSYLMASMFVHDGVLVDLGISQYDEDIAVQHLDTEAIDVNVHWFPTSHWELMLTDRLQTIAFGAGGGTSAYVLAQVHYRL